MTNTAHRDLKLASALSGQPIGDIVAQLARKAIEPRIGTTSKKGERR
jgi:hypothetical protein